MPSRRQSSATDCSPRKPSRRAIENLAAARLRYIAGSEWSTKRYLNMELLKDQQMSAIIA
jgi:hypothetical protein